MPQVRLISVLVHAEYTYFISPFPKYDGLCNEFEAIYVLHDIVHCIALHQYITLAVGPITAVLTMHYDYNYSLYYRTCMPRVAANSLHRLLHSAAWD